MSSCLSGGGGRTYRLDLEIIKSTSYSSITSNSSSPSSIISESSNSPIVISTRKARTPRKRPNQTYNEAAAILSTANPKLFSSKHFPKPGKFTKNHSPFFDDSSELLLPMSVFGNPEKPISRIGLKLEKDFYPENIFPGKPPNYEDDFDTESMLDEEIEEGIDSIMGNLSVENDKTNESIENISTTCFGYPLGLGFNLGFDLEFGMRGGVKALRKVDEENWWSFPTVDLGSKVKKESSQKKKKVEKYRELNSISEEKKEDKKKDEESGSGSKPNLLLKLNYEEVLKAWSDRGSPFPDENSGSGSESCGKDIHARLALIDLFGEGGGVREASVMRYKEKRRTRLFSKKIRYQVRKVNADQRPRMKGRFVRRPNSPMSDN